MGIIIFPNTICDRIKEVFEVFDVMIFQGEAMNYKSRNYYSMLFSMIINNLGDVLFDLFIVWQVTKQTESIENAVYMIGSSILFRAILSLFIGVIVDKRNKKQMALASNICSAVIILAFFLTYNMAIKNIWVGIIYILANDINNEIYGRSYLLIASEIFDQDVFIKFQAKYSVINRIVTIAGGAVVGIIMDTLKIQIIFFIDILTFLLSAFLLKIVIYKPKSNSPKGDSFIDVICGLKSDLKCMYFGITKNSFIIKFIVIMFILNLAYGYIPYILPVKIARDFSSATTLGFIKSAMSVGEVIGLYIVSKNGQKVSRLFKISMLGNALCMLSLIFIDNVFAILMIFGLYGLLDSLTQPLFSYTITTIDSENRGKILGGIDTIILISPSLGMYIFTKMMNVNKELGYTGIAAVFIIALLIILFSHDLNSIEVSSNSMQSAESASNLN